MTAATLTAPVAVSRPVPARRGYRFELVKLLAQWRIRLLLLACWIGPAGFVAVVSRQSSLPSDTVFGRWMGQTGWAGSLVVLSFCCSWVLPFLTSLVAGDVFAVEDRLGTWRHLLVAVRSPRRIFAAKTLASLTVIGVLVVGLAASGIVGGLAAVGNRPLIGLDGQAMSGGAAAGAVLLAWATALAPTLTFAAVGLLGSVALGRSPMGLLAPAVLGLALQLAQMLPMPAIVRAALPSYAFISWRGLFTESVQVRTVLVGVLVSVVWAVVASALAFRIFTRRNFTDVAYDGAGRRLVVQAGVPFVALLLAGGAAVAAATPAVGSGIDKAKIERSLATAYAHLYRRQAHQLHRPDVTEQQLRTAASCDKGGSLVADSGPGNDWRCVVSWHIPGAVVTGSAIYQLDVTSDGRYVADGDGPQSVNGFFQVRTPTGDAPNPLWQFDGDVDLLGGSAKG